MPYGPTTQRLYTPAALTEASHAMVTRVPAENSSPPAQSLLTQYLAVRYVMRFFVILLKAAELLGLIVGSSSPQDDPASLLPGRSGVL